MDGSALESLYGIARNAGTMSKNNEELLKEIRENFDYASNYWQKIMDEGDIDMSFVSGDPWPARERAAREVRGQERPCLVYDEAGQFINQVVNEARMQNLAVSVLPEGNGSNDEKAELRGNKIREIEYKSKAQAAYIKAYECAVQRSMGFAKVGKRYVSPDSFDMELFVAPVPNPSSILVDPSCKEADFSDMQFLFELQRIPHKQFKRDYPDAQTTSFTSDMMVEYSKWVGETDVMVAAYWYIVKERRTLLHIELADGGEALAFQDDLKKAGKKLSNGMITGVDQFGQDVIEGRILRKRTSETPEVYQCITNGVEILEEIEWDGKYIPYGVCTGPEYYVNSGAGPERQIHSLIRKARNPLMMVNYYVSTEAEIIGQVPKSPYIGYEGQFEGHEEEWENVSRVPIPYLQAKAQTEATGGQVLPLPQQTRYEPPIQALEMGKESSRRSVQSAMGISSLPTAAQRQNEKSGVALRQIASQQQQGSFHFFDNYRQNFLEHMGRIMNDLLNKTYDTPRDTGFRSMDGRHEVKRINERVEDEKTGELVEHSFGDEDYSVTISTGPSSDSQREEANSFLDALAGTPMGARVMDLIVKMKQLGPIGEEIAKRLTPPDVAAQEEMGDIPPAVQQKLTEYQQAIESLNAHAEMIEEQNRQLKSDILKQALENEGKIKLKLLDIRGELLVLSVQQEGETAKAVSNAVLQSALKKLDAEIGQETQAQGILLQKAIEPPAEEKPLQTNE
jgi:hypothetical protein